MSSARATRHQRLANGEYIALLEAHAKLKSPTPEQEAWAGWACAHLGRFVEHSEHLHRARTRGFEAALLANVYAFSGETQRALEVMQGINEHALDALGRAMLERARGAISYEQGWYDRAVVHVERAWDLASGLTEATPFLPGIARLAGPVLSGAGFDQRAIPIFTRAIEMASRNPVGRAELMVIRALAFINTGAFDQAKRDLKTITSENVSPAFALILSSIRAEFSRAQGADQKATTRLLDVADEARKSNALEVEAFAHLNLCALATNGMARSYLDRARRLTPTSNPSANALLSL